MYPDNSKISTRETFLSLAILLVLTSIGTVIFLNQFQFNPAVVQSLTGQADTIGQRKLPVKRPADALIHLPQNVSPLTPPEAFTPDNLSDKINGKAELYLSAGFKRLDSQRFKDDRAADRWMEIFIYDMAMHANAFSVYSIQQRDDASPGDIGRLSYTTENALYLVHGPYYIEFIASEATVEAIQTLKILAETFIRNTPVQSKTIAEPQLFPESGLVPDSVAMIPADAFGYSKLDRVFIAQYNLDGTGLTAFLSDRKSAEAARRVAAGYYAFLGEFGGKNITPEDSMKAGSPRIVEILGTYEIIFTLGPYLAGIHEASDMNRALQLAGRLEKRLQDIHNGR